jgi:hypothetical protein
MPFIGGRPNDDAWEQQRVVLNGVLTGIFSLQAAAKTKKGRREAGLSMRKFRSGDQYFATTGPGPQLKR